MISFQPTAEELLAQSLMRALAIEVNRLIIVREVLGYSAGDLS